MYYFAGNKTRQSFLLYLLLMTFPSTYYNTQESFLVAVDCIILGFKDREIRLLVHRREMEPAKGGMSLMGGFVQKDEALNDAAIRVLTNLTGLENVFMEQVGMYGDVYRDPGERVISCVYYALIDISTQLRNTRC